VGWAFWDVKGGFQNMREEGVVEELKKSFGGEKVDSLGLAIFPSQGGMGRIRGEGGTNIGGSTGVAITASDISDLDGAIIPKRIPRRRDRDPLVCGWSPRRYVHRIRISKKSEKYTYGPDGFTSVVAIVNKASVVRDFWDEALSIAGRVEKMEIPEVKLQAHKEAKAADLELAIHEAREVAVGVFTNGSMEREGEYGGGLVCGSGDRERRDRDNGGRRVLGGGERGMIWTRGGSG